jgi:hypothetical protein
MSVVALLPTDYLLTPNGIPDKQLIREYSGLVSVDLFDQECSQQLIHTITFNAD